MSANLTWGEAADLARDGALIRRDAWPAGDAAWLRRGPGGLWEVLDDNRRLLRVVRALDFDSAEFLAQDWTTDPPDVAPDVCARAPKKSRFTPPGIGLSVDLGAAVVLHADIGASAPAGTFWIRFFLEGEFVGEVEAAAAGRYSVVAAYPSSISSVIRARIEVRSALPLPPWTGGAEWAAKRTDYFHGFLDPGSYFRELTLYDWDAWIMWWVGPGGVDAHRYTGAPSPWTVDGHITFRAVGGGMCEVVESTCNEPANGYPVGTRITISAASGLISGAYSSNTRREYEGGGGQIWLELGPI